jgi:AcrR family transcriptional regulator
VHELFRTGGPLTVTAVAELAGVSRATAYRYFPSNDTVVLQATLPAGDDPLLDGAPADLPEATDQGLPDRAAALVRRMGEWAFDHETELRTMMRLSLSPERRDLTGLRRGHTNRDRWIANLLEGLPGDVPEASRRRLAAALTPLFGADAVIWTTDIAALSRDEALHVLEWAARTLVEATLVHK